MKRHKTNKYNRLVEELSKATNPTQLKKIYDDENSKNFFEFYIKKHSELFTYKQLYVSIFFPAVSKAVALDQKEFRSSKYKDLLTLKEEDFKENLYEVVRLAYVGLFHKYENFIESLIKHTLKFYSDDFNDRKEFEQFIFDRLGYQIKDWKNFGTISRLNWIVICIKHYDSYPLKMNNKELNKGVPYEYVDYPKDQKIRLSIQGFKNDVDRVLKIFEIMYLIIPRIGLLKDIYKDDYIELMGKEFSDESHIKAEELFVTIKSRIEELKKL